MALIDFANSKFSQMLRSANIAYVYKSFIKSFNADIYRVGFKT